MAEYGKPRRSRLSTLPTLFGNPFGIATSALVLRAMMRYALERRWDRGSTSAISIEPPKVKKCHSGYGSLLPS
jgi:hypothetical protein